MWVIGLQFQLLSKPTVCAFQLYNTSRTCSELCPPAARQRNRGYDQLWVWVSLPSYWGAFPAEKLVLSLGFRRAVRRHHALGRSGALARAPEGVQGSAVAAACRRIAVRTNSASRAALMKIV